MLKIYNTLKREKEEFKPINPNQVQVCSNKLRWSKQVSGLISSVCL